MENIKKSVHGKINLRSHFDADYILSNNKKTLVSGRASIPYDMFSLEANPKYFENPFSIHILSHKSQRDKELKFKYKF